MRGKEGREVNERGEVDAEGKRGKRKVAEGGEWKERDIEKG